MAGKRQNPNQCKKFAAIYRAIKNGEIKLERRNGETVVLNSGPYWPELVRKALAHKERGDCHNCWCKGHAPMDSALRDLRSMY